MLAYVSDLPESNIICDLHNSSSRQNTEDLHNAATMDALLTGHVGMTPRGDIQKAEARRDFMEEDICAVNLHAVGRTTPRYRNHGHFITHSHTHQHYLNNCDIDTCDIASHVPKRPVKCPRGRMRPVADLGDVSRARKRLFSPAKYKEDNVSNSPNARYSPINKGRFEEVEITTRTPHYLISPQRGEKRKFPSSEAEASKNVHPARRTYIHSNGAGGGVAERLLHDLKQIDDTDVGRLHPEEDNAKCACSVMKENILQMAEHGFRSIQIPHSSSANVGAFSRELRETNSVLQESVRLLKAVQEICCYERKFRR